MNAEYQTALNRLKSKIGVLVSRFEQIKAENDRMAAELTTLKTILNENKTTVSELEQKVNRLQMAEAFKASSADVKEAKQRIGKLIKEIDKCIALLNT
jgi:chromosome segregation ATPase